MCIGLNKNVIKPAQLQIILILKMYMKRFLFIATFCLFCSICLPHRKLSSCIWAIHIFIFHISIPLGCRRWLKSLRILLCLKFPSPMPSPSPTCWEYQPAWLCTPTAGKEEEGSNWKMSVSPITWMLVSHLLLNSNNLG